MLNSHVCRIRHIIPKWNTLFELIGAALENFPAPTLKKKIPRRQEKRNPLRGQKEQLVPLPKLPISALNNGGQYPPGVIILRCSHRVLQV